MTTNQRPRTFRRIIAELPFIPATSNWLKLLFSLLAEPLMFVASLCIIAETVLPGASTWPGILTNGPTVVMSLAPEIILPGCFQQAQYAHRQGNPLKGNLLFCLCALFGMLTLVTLASFLWHFAGAIDNLILFIRCGSGISYTIILNISGDDEQGEDSTGPDDQIEHLTQTVNSLTAQLTTVLSITQNNQFLVSSLSETAQATQIQEVPQALALPDASAHLSMEIQPLRLRIQKGQTNLHLLTLVEHHPLVAPNDIEMKTLQEHHEAAQEKQPPVTYPVVPGVSKEKVRQLIDACLQGTKWRDMPGNYSQTIKPVREAWERMQSAPL
jgi:hypothetical protein